SELPADSFKFRDYYRRFMPKLDTAQRLGLPVHAPERAHVPSQTLAHSPQYSRSCLFDRGRFRQDLRDRVLHAEAFLYALALRQVEHESDTLVPAFFDGCQADQHGNTAAVFPKVLLLKRRQTPGYFQLRQPPSFIAVKPFRRRQLSPAQAACDHIFTILPYEAHKCVICLENLPLHIPDKNPDDIGIDQTPDLRFAFFDLSVQSYQ